MNKDFNPEKDANILIQEGLLIEDKTCKHPLSLFNLQLLFKAYYYDHNIGYKTTINLGRKVPTTYRLTPEGLEWLYSYFEKHSLEYLKKAYSQLFNRATEYDHQHLREYKMLTNFRGEGKVNKPREDNGLGFLITLKVNRCIREYREDTLQSARIKVNSLIALYPIENIKLYKLYIDKRDGSLAKNPRPLFATKANRTEENKKQFNEVRI